MDVGIFSLKSINFLKLPLKDTLGFAGADFVAQSIWLNRSSRHKALVLKEIKANAL